jgi:hypothetical protein
MSNNHEQENLILKKRLNICRTSKGNLSKIPDDLIIDIIRAWERWPSTAKSFYCNIGIKKQQLANIIKKGKRLFKESKEKLGPFIPVEVKQPEASDNNKVPIILTWDKKRSIRFYQVNHLVEFLKQAA